MAGRREEVASKGLNQQFLEAARAIARRLSAARPAPGGASTWSPEEIDDLVFDTVARVSPDKLVLAANEAADDHRFRSYLNKAIRSTLDLRARDTPEGRVIRSLDDALREEPERFRLVAGHWRLCTDDDRVPSWQGRLVELVDVAWTVPVATVQMSASTNNKTPPVGTRRDVRAVAAAVLGRSGPLPKAQLAEVIATRFNVAFEVRFDYLGDDERVQILEAGESSTAAERAAACMYAQLTGDERRVLAGYLEGGGVRGIAGVLGCSKYKAGVLLERLQLRLRHLADETASSSREATENLLQLCRTNTASAAFTEDVEAR